MTLLTLTEGNKVSQHGYFFREIVSLPAVILCSLLIFVLFVLFIVFRGLQCVHYAARVLAIFEIFEIIHALADYFPLLRLPSVSLSQLGSRLIAILPKLVDFSFSG